MSYCLLLAAAYVLGGVAWPDRSARPAHGRWFYRLLVGFALCAALVIVVGSYRLAAAQMLLAIIAIAGLLGQGALRARGKPRVSAPPEDFPPLSWAEYGCLAVTGAALFMSLLSAMAPITGWDATVAHLALPADYQRHGSIYLQQGNVYSGYPHLMHSLYTMAYYSPSGGMEKTAALLAWTFSALGCYAVYLLGRRMMNRLCGLLSAAIFATAPIFADQAGTVGIDLPFALFSTAALTCLAEWFLDRDGAGRQETHWLVLAAFFAGTCCGIRHTGYLICFIMAIAVLYGNPQGRIREFAIFSAMALAASAPWWLRSAIVVGNPLFPFLLELFPRSPIDHILIDGATAHESVTATGGATLWKLLRFPWDIIMRPDDFDGWSKSPGGLILILGVPGLFIAGSRARWLGAYGAAGGTAFFFFQRFARYLLPFFVPAMVIAAMAALRLPRLKWLILPVIGLSFTMGLAIEAASLQFKLPVLMGFQTRHDYLSSRIERYAGFDYANAYLNDGSVILTFDQRSYFIDGPAFQNHWALKRISRQPFTIQYEWLRQAAIRYIIVPVDYLEESGALRDDVAPMVAQWRKSRNHFELLTILESPRMRGQGVERIEIYRVRNS